jgi:hypothetical protein
LKLHYLIETLSDNPELKMGKSKKKCKSSDEAKPANKPIQNDGNNESEKTQESSAVDMHVDVQGGTVDAIIESQKNIQPSESYQNRQYDDARSREPVAHKEFNRSYGGGSEGRNSTSYSRQRDSSDQEFNNYGKTRRSEPYKRNNYDSGDGRREKKRSSWNENESNRRSARDSNVSLFTKMFIVCFKVWNDEFIFLFSVTLFLVHVQVELCEAYLTEIQSIVCVRLIDFYCDYGITFQR